MTLSVIIPTYNRNERLCETITDVLRFEGQYHEFIIVDQTREHDEKTARFLSTLVMEKKIFLLESDFPNLPDARNRGVSISTGDIVLFIDDDVTLTDTFFSSHLSRHEDNTIGGVVGRVFIQNSDTNGNIVLEKKSPLKQKIKSLFFFFFRKKVSYITPWGILSDYTKNKRLAADSLIGCNMSFKKEIFDKGIYFDSNFTGNALREDTDMSIRVRKAGYRLVYEPEAALIHHMENSGGTRTAESEDYWHTFFKNQAYFFLKHFSTSLAMLHVVLCFELVRCKKRGYKTSALLGKSYQEALKLLNYSHKDRS